MLGLIFIDIDVYWINENTLFFDLAFHVISPSTQTKPSYIKSGWFFDEYFAGLKLLRI